VPQPFWHEALPSILAAHNGKPSAIIFLIFPAVAQGAERWSVGPSEQCEICDSFERFEHNIIGQEAKKIVDCWDMNIVKCEDCADLQSWINGVVLQLWERKGVRPVDEGEVNGIIKLKGGQRLLSGAEYERGPGGAIERRLCYKID